MNKEIAARWVAALRSGEYKQGSGWLNADDRFCCLGVLCDLAVKEGVVKAYHSEINGVTYYGPADGSYTDAVLLARGVKEWAGMGTIDGAFKADADCLAAINDMGRPFSYIADLIEREMENL